MLPGLMGLKFNCKDQMVGSEFRVNDMKACNHPVFYLWFRLLWAVFALENLSSLVTAEHNLNTTAYQSIVGDHAVTTVYPSSGGCTIQLTKIC